MSTLTAPNVLSYAYRLESGTVVTLFRSVPGDTTPRMQMQPEGGQAVDCGAIDNPERFGPFGTPAEFEAWAQRFAAEA